MCNDSLFDRCNILHRNVTYLTGSNLFDRVVTVTSFISGVARTIARVTMICFFMQLLGIGKRIGSEMNRNKINE